MIDNFFQDNYHSYDKVYQHPETNWNIYLGDMQAALDDDFLRNKNIKTVITAAKDMDHIVLDRSIEHIVYPLLDSKLQSITPFFDSFYQIVEKSIKTGSILVHCAAGISRSSTLVISYIMKKQKKTFKQAIALVRKGRPNVLPNLGFERQLKQYQIALEKNFKPSRNCRRGEVKTSQSSKRPYILKSQILAQNDGLGNKSHFNIDVLPLNTKKLSDKYTNKQMRILKIYSNNYYQEVKRQFKNKIKMRKLLHYRNDRLKKPEIPQRSSISASMNRDNFDNGKRTKTNVSTDQRINKVEIARNNRFINMPNLRGIEGVLKHNFGF